MGPRRPALAHPHLVTDSTDDRSALPPLEELYDAHCEFVFRVLRRLGVPEASVEDAVQDVFVVVLDRGDGFEGRSTFRTWLYGIALRVARRARRRQRHEANVDDVPLPDARPGPARWIEHAEELALLDALLEELDEPFREVFVLAEIEQLTAPQIADITGVPVNTAYSRLRLARRRFEAALRRHRARQRGMTG